jgi:Fe-S-cluster containining protein
MSEPEAPANRWPASHLWQPVPSFTPPPPEAARQLADLWQDLDRQLAQPQAACRACGQCCDFPRRGHVLFATSLELNVCLSYARDHAVTTRPAARRRLAAGECPFLAGGRCAVRPARPIGCRIFFCCPPHPEPVEKISSSAQQRLRSISREHNGSAWYGPALAFLETNVSEF